MKYILAFCLLGLIIYIIVGLVNSPNTSDYQKYPDSVRVLTINGDTATIYSITGHPAGSIRVTKKK